MTKPGRILLITGPMFSMKSEMLIRHMHEEKHHGYQVLGIAHKSDERYGAGGIASKTGAKWEGDTHLASSAAELVHLDVSHHAVIGLDECQFFDKSLVRLVERWSVAGKRVIVSGLDRDHHGRTWDTTAGLFGAAHRVLKLHSTCAVCNEVAVYSMRKALNDNPVMVGGADSYEPRCAAHWVRP